MGPKSECHQYSPFFLMATARKKVGNESKSRELYLKVLKKSLRADLSWTCPVSFILNALGENKSIPSDAEIFRRDGKRTKEISEHRHWQSQRKGEEHLRSSN